jgi:hypothetical protein
MMYQVVGPVWEPQSEEEGFTRAEMLAEPLLEKS